MIYDRIEEIVKFDSFMFYEVYERVKEEVEDKIWMQVLFSIIIDEDADWPTLYREMPSLIVGIRK